MNPDTQSRIQSSFKISAPILQTEHKVKSAFDKSPSFTEKSGDNNGPSENFFSVAHIESNGRMNDTQIQPHKKSFMEESNTYNSNEGRNKHSASHRQKASHASFNSQNIASNSTVRVADSLELPVAKIDTQTKSSYQEKRRQEKKKGSSTSTIESSAVLFAKTSEILLEIPEDMGSQDFEKFNTLTRNKKKTEKALKEKMAKQSSVASFSSFSALPIHKQQKHDASFIKYPVHEVLGEKFVLSSGNLLDGIEHITLAEKMKKSKKSSLWKKFRHLFSKKQVQVSS